MKLQLAALAAFTFAAVASGQHLSSDGAAQTFTLLSSQYFEQVYFHFSPTAGTSAGLHQYDTQLEDYSAANVASESAALQEWEKKFEAIPADGLDAEPAADLRILLNSIHAQLLSLNTIRPWEKNPDTYSSGITSSVFSIMERPYAPANTRLRAVIAREKMMPQVFLEARKNLKNPPHIYTEIALEQIDDEVSFFQNDVPSAFADATDKTAQAEFAQTNAAVIEALKSYGAWMKSDPARALRRRLPLRRRHLPQGAFLQ